jgi:hypothetical protein
MSRDLKQSNQTAAAPAWEADHYSAELDSFVLHIHRHTRRRKVEGTNSYQPYEYYSWRVAHLNHRDREAGRGVASSKSLAEAACYAVVEAVKELSENALLRLRDLDCYEDEN